MKKSRFVAFLIFAFYWIWSRTWRFTVYEPPDLQQKLKNKETVLLAHWHGDELVLFRLIGQYRVATMASTSKDGELMNNMIHFIGGKTSRGSSTRGAVAGLKGLLRLVKEENMNSSIAVDGPKGPIYQVKPGIFELSRLLDAPIYTAGVSYSTAIHFPKSWNKTFWPKLFSRVHVHWQGPIGPISRQHDPRSEDLAKSLASDLNAARQQAFKHIAVFQSGL
ncbi:MAG: lysophospholipid acyltransferase family protein [Pseudobdellovibrionaceae bacterium]